MCAAAISPMEWPERKSGFRPQLSRSRNRATSTANSAGWVYSVRSRTSASNPNRTSFRGSSRSIRAHTPSRASANTGWDSYSSRPIPSRWLPCPVNRNASLPATGEPSTSPAAGPPSASDSRPASSAARSAATTAARCSNADRPRARESPRSAGLSSGWSTAWACSRRAWSRRASRLLPERIQGSGGASGVAVSGAGTGSAGSAVSGACSMMVWALVPLMPKDETPARRGRPVSGHSTGSVSRAMSPAVQSTCGVGSSTCSVGGSTPLRMARTILMMPATPAAAWV
ncbi:hypothetical protein EES37_20665 [Streptomyces sp. ADI91-18]|nr:hypothetical protein EES37_20665 [Streptomyces sp. ADI91-18]